MGKVNKEMVYKKFKENNETNKVLSNKEKIIEVGDTEIIIKRLDWDSSNDFEDKLLSMLSDFSNISLDTENVNISGLLQNVLGSLLRQGLLDLVGIATKGEINIEFIREHNVSKNDVIECVMESVFLNYSYVKNLISLGKVFK